MKMIEKTRDNQFAKFFNYQDYILLKNNLFNYRFRKYMLYKAYKKYLGKNNVKIADIGCGISPVSPFQKKTLFIEYEKNAIDILSKQGYKAINGRVEKIPLKDNSLDVIFSSEVLEHVKDYKKGIIEFNRVLKKEGLLFITVPTNMEYWDFDDEYVGHHRRFEIKSLAKDIENCGFKILEIKPIGSLIERTFTKVLVRRAINNKEDMKLSNLKIKTFFLLNRILFFLIWIAYLLNNEKNSSIGMIVARKKN